MGLIGLIGPIGLIKDSVIGTWERWPWASVEEMDPSFVGMTEEGSVWMTKNGREIRMVRIARYLLPAWQRVLSAFLSGR